MPEAQCAFIHVLSPVPTSLDKITQNKNKYFPVNYGRDFVYPYIQVYREIPISLSCNFVHIHTNIITIIIV